MAPEAECFHYLPVASGSCLLAVLATAMVRMATALATAMATMTATLTDSKKTRL